MEKNFIVYKSSAGSGKTFTLVVAYIKLVLLQEDPTRYRNILAITFTNKAANELKERILVHLRILSLSRNDLEYDTTLVQHYANELKLPEEILNERAKIVFESILHNYSDLKVSTIDKFTHKIIRAFSRDLGLQHDFDIELDTDLMLTLTVHELIADAGSDDDLSSILLQVVDQQVDQDKSWDVESGLLKFAKELIKEESIDYLDYLKKFNEDQFKSAYSQLTELRSNSKQKVMGYASEIIGLLNTSNIPLALFPNQTLPKYYKTISEGNINKSLETLKTIVNAIDENQDKWLVKTASPSDLSNLESIKPTIRILHAKMEEEIGRYFLYDLLHQNIYSLSLINFIYKKLEKIKEEEAILLISDFNQIIASQIKDQPAPFIYEKIGERYQNIMIDEFQDTSILQWQNILPLIDNSLAFGHQNLIVGDAKQAIYRFRGGKVEQFAELPSIYQHNNDPILLEREQALQHNYNANELNTNYRSHQQIIEFNNWLFKDISTSLHHQYNQIYAGVKQQFNSNKNKGYVHVQFIDKKISDNLVEDYLNHTLVYIQEALNDQFNYNDITVLVRNQKDSVLVSDFLLAHQIPVLTNESLVIHENKQVNFLVHFLYYLFSPNDNKAKLEIIKYLVEENKLHESLITHKYLDVQEVLNKIGFKTDLINLQDTSIYDLSEYIIRAFNLHQHGQNPFINTFLEKVYDFSKFQNDLAKFLDWWKEKGKKISISTPKDINAVTIMTIHKSKGLQFPIVICPFVNWPFKPTNLAPQKWIYLDGLLDHLDLFLIPLKKQLKKTSYSWLLDQEKEIDLLDNINLLYVSLTRPEQRLYIISDNDVITTKKEPKDNLISYYVWKTISSHTDFNTDHLSLTIGNKYKKVAHKSESINSVSIYTYPITNWRDKVSISETFKKEWDPKGYQEKIAFGNKVHQILAQVTNPSEAIECIEYQLKEGIISIEEKELLLHEVKGILSIPQVNKWFSSNGIIKNEKELLTKHGEILRPDKVIIENNRTIILDFKTGDPSSKDKQQVEEYASILNDMKYPNIEAWIIYTKNRELTKIL